MRGVWIAALGVTGCTGAFGDGTQTGTEVPLYCEPTGLIAIGSDVVVDDVGASADEILAEVGGDHVGAFTPTTGEEVSSNAAIMADGAPSRATFELVTVHVDSLADADPDAPTSCPDQLHVPIRFEFTTDGGLLDESTSTALIASATSATVHMSVPIDAVGGSTRPETFDPADWAQVTLDGDATLDDRGWTGSFTWVGANEAAEVADTGQIEPSGTSETLGTWAAAH